MRGVDSLWNTGTMPHVDVTPYIESIGPRASAFALYFPRLQGDAIADERRPVDDKHIGSRGLSVLQWSIAGIWGLPLLLCCCVSWTSGFIYVKCVPSARLLLISSAADTSASPQLPPPAPHSQMRAGCAHYQALFPPLTPTALLPSSCEYCWARGLGARALALSHALPPPCCFFPSSQVYRPLRVPDAHVHWAGDSVCLGSLG